MSVIAPDGAAAAGDVPRRVPSVLPPRSVTNEVSGAVTASVADDALDVSAAACATDADIAQAAPAKPATMTTRSPMRVTSANRDVERSMRSRRVPDMSLLLEIWPIHRRYITVILPLNRVTRTVLENEQIAERTRHSRGY